MRTFFKTTFTILLYTFALIGFFLVSAYVAVKFGWTNTKGIIDRQTENFYTNTANQTSGWAQTDEWNSFKEAVTKDTPTLLKVESETGVPARLIVSLLAVEQLRLFTSEREFFKQAFYPLKILGSQTQFSWGVMGIKPDTAKDIESHLVSTSSPYYLGIQFEHMLDFKTEDIENERFTRMTDEHDHYYNYLYGALYIKQFETEWKNAGMGIEHKPEILGTLYNIGFAHSEPKIDPQVGGAEITIGGVTYSFGGLVREIYNSNELINIFPRK